MADWVTVAKRNAIVAGQGDSFRVGERLIAVFCVDGTYYAIDDTCPHMGASLGAGPVDEAEGVVTCPWHAWRFNVKTGTWCDNPSLGVATYEVRVDGDQLQVRVPDEAG